MSEIVNHPGISGKSISLNEHNLYSLPTSARRNSTVTGDYFVFSDEEVNGKVPICIDKDSVGVEGKIYGWINYSGVKDQVTDDCSDLDEPELSKTVDDTSLNNESEPSNNLDTFDDFKDEVDCTGSQNLSEEVREVDGFSKGDVVKLDPSAIKWFTGEDIPSWLKRRTLYVRSTPVDGKCQVGTLMTGLAHGVIETKYLLKV